VTRQCTKRAHEPACEPDGGRPSRVPRLSRDLRLNPRAKNKTFGNCDTSPHLARRSTARESKYDFPGGMIPNGDPLVTEGLALISLTRGRRQDTRRTPALCRSSIVVGCLEGAAQPQKEL